MLRGRPAYDYGTIPNTPQSSGYGGLPAETNCRALCDRIGSQIFSINASVNTVEQALKRLGTSRDTSESRQKLHETEQATNASIKEVVNLLRELSAAASRLPSDNRTYKLQFERLKAEFEEAVQRYHAVQKKVADKVKSTNIPKAPSVPTGDLLSWEDTNSSRTQYEQQEQQALLVVDSSNVDLELALEREQQIRQLEGDILNINQIFRDLQVMVHEQGDTIDTIEANVSMAHDNVEAGRDQLIKASNYQARSRKMKCCLIGILLTILAIIIIIIVVVLKVK